MNNHACVDPYQLFDKKRYFFSWAIEVTLVNRRLINLKK